MLWLKLRILWLVSVLSVQIAAVHLVALQK